MTGWLPSLSTDSPPTPSFPKKAFPLLQMNIQPSQVDGVALEANEDHGNNTADKMIVLLQKLVAEVQTLNQNVRLFSSYRLRQDFQQPGPQTIRQEQHQDAQRNPADTETGLSSLTHAIQLGHPTKEELAMLERFPALELFPLMFKELEAALGPCDCKIGGEPVSIFSMGQYRSKTPLRTHWSFRNAVLVFFTNLVPSAPLRFTLHSPDEKQTPDVTEACLKFIRTQWPSSIVGATWTMFPEPLEPEDPYPF
jgi:hypothetical protein